MMAHRWGWALAAALVWPQAGLASSPCAQRADTGPLIAGSDGVVTVPAKGKRVEVWWVDGASWACGDDAPAEPPVAVGAVVARRAELVVPVPPDLSPRSALLIAVDGVAHGPAWVPLWLWGVDSDGDSLEDAEEASEHGTHPRVADTDGDGVDDGWEVRLGSNPLVADTDGDGLDDEADPCPAEDDCPRLPAVSDVALTRFADEVFDPEIDAATGSVVWQPRQGQSVWAATLDPSTGALVPANGRGLRLGRGVTPSSLGQNGPELLVWRGVPCALYFQGPTDAAVPRLAPLSGASPAVSLPLPGINRMFGTSAPHLGHVIAFDTDLPQSPAMVLDVDRAQVTTLPVSASWGRAADGTSSAFLVSDQPGARGIYRFDVTDPLATWSPVAGGNFRAGRPFVHPSWGADLGVAVVRVHEGGPDRVEVWRLTPAGPQQVTSARGSFAQPTLWSVEIATTPAGVHVVFFSGSDDDATRRSSLWRLPLDGSPLERLVGGDDVNRSDAEVWHSGFGTFFYYTEILPNGDRRWRRVTVP